MEKISALFSFNGVVSRIGYLVAQCLAVLALAMMYLFSGSGANDVSMVAAMVFGITGVWIALAADVRRLHDTNTTGWWALLRFIPLVNLLLLLYLLFVQGDGLNNRYTRRYHNGDTPRGMPHADM